MLYVHVYKKKKNIIYAFIVHTQFNLFHDIVFL